MTKSNGSKKWSKYILFYVYVGTAVFLLERAMFFLKPGPDLDMWRPLGILQ